MSTAVLPSACSTDVWEADCTHEVTMATQQGVEGSRSHRSERVLIFDWDDTLFPSSWISSMKLKLDGAPLSDDVRLHTCVCTWWLMHCRWTLYCMVSFGTRVGTRRGKDILLLLLLPSGAVCVRAVHFVRSQPPPASYRPPRITPSNTCID